MQITTKAWRNYIERMSSISKEAGSKMQEWVSRNGFSDDKALLDYAYALVTHYGEAIGELSCQMYEATAAAQGVTVPAAEMAELPSYGEVAKVVHGSKKQSEAQVPRAMSRIVKQVGADTTLKNAQRDGAQFAWISSGDTCAFCLTLASRGWQYMSKNTLKNGHAEHIHANCDCQYAIRFDRKSSVEGYDPEGLREKYDSFPGSPKDKIRQWQNEFREAHKELINAQKRARYAITATGGRILDLFGKYENKWAENYYEEIRHKTTDCKKIAQKLGISEKDVKDIKSYLFLDKSLYNELTDSYERFAADPAIAQSWQRLSEGKEILQHDRTLIDHELYEMKLKKENPNMSHGEAHLKATLKYNYQEEAKEYYANLRESKKSE